jgi:glutamate racemase
MHKHILVLDSGVGGFSVLNECRRLMPSEHFLYVTDTKNASYGNKSKKKLNKIALSTVNNFLKNYDIKLILLACNTLTATSINLLRKKINLPFVGVEPAIKKALEEGKNNILLLSTKATLKYNKKLIALKKQKLKNIYFVPLKNLAKKIDDNLQDLTKLQPYLNKLFKKYVKKNINSVVLGCTHYKFVTNELKTALKNIEITFFESSTAVAKRVQFLLSQANSLNTVGEGSTTVICTKRDENMEKKFVIYLKKQ